MKKLPLIVIVAVAGVLFVGGTLAYAQGVPNGDPFSALWNAVKELRVKISNIQLIPGPQGPQGPIGPQGERGPVGLQLHLVDANGQDLGVFVDSGGQDNPSLSRTFLPQLNVFVHFFNRYDNDGPGPNQNQSVVFENATQFIFLQQNCAGDTWYRDGSNPLQLLKNYVNQYFKGDGSVSLVTFQSRLDAQGRCMNENSGPIYAGLLHQVMLPFTEPLAWPLSIVSM